LLLGITEKQGSKAPIGFAPLKNEAGLNLQTALFAGFSAWVTKPLARRVHPVG
jgi:hypothetical protein